MSDDMKDLLEMMVGITVPLFIVMGTFVGTLIALATINSLWGLLLFLTWPFIAAATVMFILWWDER